MAPPVSLPSSSSSRITAAISSRCWWSRMSAIAARWSWEIEEVAEASLDDLPRDLAPVAREWIAASAPSICSAMHRLFVGIRPPSTVRDLLLDAMDDSPDFRWQDDEQLHLTLRFVGAVDRPQAEDLAAALGRVQAAHFALRIAGVGSFDHRNSGALWAGVDPKPPVASLASKIERACQSIGLAPERRAFHPHITIARWSGRRTPRDPRLARTAIGPAIRRRST